MARPQVGVNLLWLVPGVVGGSEDAVCATLAAVAAPAADAGLDLRLFVLDGFAGAHPEIADVLPTTPLTLTGRAKGLRVAAEQTWLARATRTFDLVHHAGGTLPLVRTAPSTLMVHDLQPLDLPDNFSATKRRYLGAMLPRSVRAARAVCVPSRFVAEGVQRLGVPASRLRVIPNPVPTPHADPALLSTLRVRLGLPGPYVLYPAITYAHKNHRVLLEAWAGLVGRHPEARLLLTGGEGPVEAEVRDRLLRADVAGTVIRPGRLPRRELEALLCGATALACPSRYEGFGIPVLEAARVGVPVVAARATALVEVAPPTATLVDPDDVAGWTAALDAVLAAGATARRIGGPVGGPVLGPVGEVVADGATPEKAAEALVAMWREALEQ